MPLTIQEWEWRVISFFIYGKKRNAHFPYLRCFLFCLFLCCSLTRTYTQTYTHTRTLRQRPIRGQSSPSVITLVWSQTITQCDLSANYPEKNIQRLRDFCLHACEEKHHTSMLKVTFIFISDYRLKSNFSQRTQVSIHLNIKTNRVMLLRAPSHYTALIWTSEGVLWRLAPGCCLVGLHGLFWRIL